MITMYLIDLIHILTVDPVPVFVISFSVGMKTSAESLESFDESNF